jgi:hypothetical protein
MSPAEVALTVAIASACISLAGLAWNLTLYRLSGARLNVRLMPAILTAEGNLMRGADKGWREPVPEPLEGLNRDYFVDLAIIKVTNVGRTPVSVSDISLDFGRSGWRPGWRHTVGGTPIPIHECSDVKGDVRLEAGSSVSVAIDDQPLIDYALSHSSKWNISTRATATAAGRRPTRSAWRRRWSQSDATSRYFPAESTPERQAFVEVFRAVYPHDVTKVYAAWVATTALLLRDANADAVGVANELAQVLELGPLADLNFVSSGQRVLDLLPNEITLGSHTAARGAMGQAPEQPT